MAVQHAGNAVNQIAFEEHDGSNNAKRVNVVAGGVGQATVAINSAVTIYAVVNTGGSAANVTLNPSPNFIGLATVVTSGNITVLTRNAGTNKTLVNLPFAFSLTSVATIVVPTNANTIYLTNLLLSANATTQVRLKSGVTYQTGNASIGISLNPNGGFTLPGAPDSPSWIGLASGALVLEKNDITTLVGGHIVYFQE